MMYWLQSINQPVLVKLTPKTERQHQLRRHMKHVFDPIIGDTKYGDLHQNRAWSACFGFHRLLLQVYSLQFSHPIMGNLIQIKARPECKFFTPRICLNGRSQIK